MKFTVSWLKEYLTTDSPVEAICEKLTAIGLEVEHVSDRTQSLAPFLIAEVLTAEKHPQADRLEVASVTTGTETFQIVCGAPNCRAGLKVVLARPGDLMPDTGEKLKKGLIRGIESQGMLCSSDELRLESASEGILELPADAPVGQSFMKFMKLDDPIIEINLTPNRSDCAGVYGIARDLAASGLGQLKPHQIKMNVGTFACPIGVTLDFTEDTKKNCPHFVGRLIKNIKNGPSPDWLRQRLTSIGLRSISALVDITNYLTFDCGRPLHVFDAKKLKGKIRVTSAKGGETMAALDGNTYTLQAGMTVILDDAGVIGIGGIIGGESTKCDETTTDVFIEAAYFDPVRTARTGRALKVTSDARYRFERGIDPLFTVPGLEQATQLVLNSCSTSETVISALETAGSPTKAAAPINFSWSSCLKRTGVDMPSVDQQKILTALGFSIVHKDEGLHVSSPSWRPDIEGPADLVEEIIRVKGYDCIEAISLPRDHAVTSSAIDIQDQRANSLRRGLSQQGLMEAVTWSFMSDSLATHFVEVSPHLRIENPISSDLSVMRPTILGNLLSAVKRNADRGFQDVGLFEVGPIFKDSTPEGQIMVAASLRSGSTPRNWALSQRPFDAFDAKSDVLAALVNAGCPIHSLQVTMDAPAYYHPGRSGALRLGPIVIGYFGELHPTLLGSYGLGGPVVASEIFVAALPKARSAITAKPLLKLDILQAVTRDFAFVVDADVSAAKLIKAVRDADKNFIRDVNVFDVYDGEHVAKGKKSVALSVVLQPSDKTLTDPEIDAIGSRITSAALVATGAVLRA